MTNPDSKISMVGVVILNYNGWQDTIECAESVLKCEVPKIIVIVDNNSTDDSLGKLKNWMGTGQKIESTTVDSYSDLPVTINQLSRNATPGNDCSFLTQVILIPYYRNGGYASGNNVGIEYALRCGCDYVWILNNDTVVSPDALSSLLNRVNENPSIGLCGSTLVYYNNSNVVQTCAGGRFRPLRGWSCDIGEGLNLSDRPDLTNVEKQLSYVNGASMLVSRKFITDIGLMEESYFLYSEEIDWAFRARGKYKLGYAPNSIVRHKLGSSIGTSHHGRQSRLADFYMLRGAMLFCLRYSKISIPGVILLEIRAIIRLLKKREYSRILDKFRALTLQHYPPDRKDVNKKRSKPISEFEI